MFAIRCCPVGTIKTAAKPASISSSSSRLLPAACVPARRANPLQRLVISGRVPPCKRSQATSPRSAPIPSPAGAGGFKSPGCCPISAFGMGVRCSKPARLYCTCDSGRHAHTRLRILLVELSGSCLWCGPPLAASYKKQPCDHRTFTGSPVAHMGVVVVRLLARGRIDAGARKARGSILFANPSQPLLDRERAPAPHR